MITLGICNGETASACLLEDGELIAAVSEERFSRIKMDSSFPLKSIEFILKNRNITIDKVDNIAYAWSKGVQKKSISDYLERYIQAREEGSDFNIILERLRIESQRDEKQELKFWEWAKSSLNRKQQSAIKSYYHHESHALSAGLFSGFKECICLTADGRGDYESITAWYFQKEECMIRYRKLYSETSIDSLGFFYGRITGLLGFKPCRHEGKITGLAAKGDPSKTIKLMEKMINFQGGRLKGNLGKYYRPFYTNYSADLMDEVNKYDKADIAAGAQKHLEVLLCKITENIYRENNIKAIPLCVAGGIFANVKVNQKLKELSCVEQLFVQPQMGDGGLCLGAAAGLQNEHGIPIKKLESMYLGPRIEEKVLQDFIRNKKVTSKKLDNRELIQAIIKYLKNNNVIGLTRGKMEFGPRALCNRSILYKTTDVSANDWLNERMNRTEFMPFAPVMTTKQAKVSLIGYREEDITGKFMTSTYSTTKEFQKRCPAVNHTDNTARPQIVSYEEDPFLYELLEEWEKESGEMSLINTSFNAHEEPIVCQDIEALEALLSGMIDVLVLNDKLIKRTETN